ncbi:MAG: NPCBM/NEW2 domain-containing protein, partial [Planctomycetales bacterium]|nr:NPCBM/NEW2 domain-containing protein [Planctomycetales bacterium]
QVELACGTRIAASNFQVKDGRATVVTLGGKQLQLDARRVSSVRFLPQDERVRELWNSIVASRPKGDAVVVRKGGDGKPIVLDFLEGAVRDVSSASIQFDFEGDTLQINRSRVRVEGIVYYEPAQRAPPQAVCQVEDAGGDLWRATRLSIDGDALSLETPTGLSHSVPLARVRTMDFSLGKIVYLSDLAAIKESWQPFVAVGAPSPETRRLFQIRRDEGLGGGPLALGETQFRKGLAMHSRSEITFRLPGSFSRFVATCGIDTRLKRPGNVRLEVRGDDKVLLDREISAESGAAALDVDISGSGRLTILVDYGQGLDIGDQLIMGGARVIR